MAESVDATVSNTVGATHPGSSPGPGTEKECFTSKHSFFSLSPKKPLSEGGGGVSDGGHFAGWAGVDYQLVMSLAWLLLLFWRKPTKIHNG